MFPVDGIRQAPMSPIDGKPMKRVDSDAVQDILAARLANGAPEVPIVLAFVDRV